MKLVRIASLILLLVGTAILVVFLTRKGRLPESLPETEAVSKRREEVRQPPNQQNLSVPNPPNTPLKVERDLHAEKEQNIAVISAASRQHFDLLGNSCGPHRQGTERLKEDAKKEYEQKLRESFSDNELAQIADLLKNPMVQKARRVADDYHIDSTEEQTRYEDLDKSFLESIGGSARYEELESNFHMDTLPFPPDKKAAFNDAVDAYMSVMERRAFFEVYHHSAFAKRSQMRDDRLRITIRMAMAFAEESTENLHHLTKALSQPAMQKELLEMMNFDLELCPKFSNLLHD